MVAYQLKLYHSTIVEPCPSCGATDCWSADVASDAEDPYGYACLCGRGHVAANQVAVVFIADSELRGLLAELGASLDAAFDGRCTRMTECGCGDCRREAKAIAAWMQGVPCK